MCQVIAITNQKGGVGKTTTTFHLGTKLAQEGKRVLLIDADPQASLTACFGIRDADTLDTTLTNALQAIVEDEPIDPRMVIRTHEEGAKLFPANIELASFETAMINVMSREYIRLTNLIPDILEMVDEGRIAFRPAVELSYLSEAEQAYLLEEMTYNDATPSLAQAIKMHNFAKEGKLSSEVIESIMSEEKPNQREKISFRADRLRQYIPDSVPREKTEEYVMRALQHYREYQIRQASRSAR